MPFSLYTLKQIRDVADPLKACYQSLVRVPRILDEVFDLREIDETLRVRIHEFPSLKLVQQLGIVARTVREGGAGIVYGTQAIRPFYIRAIDPRVAWRAFALACRERVEWKGDKVNFFLRDAEPRNPSRFAGRARAGPGRRLPDEVDHASVDRASEP